jgi:hypothetical protein
MKRAVDSICAGLLSGCFTFIALAQQPAKAVAVPPLVKFSGVLTAGTGRPLSGVVGVTFALAGTAAAPPSRSLPAGAPRSAESPADVAPDVTGTGKADYIAYWT